MKYNILILSFLVLIVSCNIVIAVEETFVPSDPTNITNTTGNFWVNHTWNAGVEVSPYGWHLIVGNVDGVFCGFNRTDSTWQEDNIINNSLPDIGSGSQATIFKKDGAWYLISGYNMGGFYGFKWAGSTWESNNTIVGGLGSAQFWSAPIVFEKDEIWYLISGYNEGNFYGFNWTGSLWQSDSVIISGLPDIGEDSTPNVFEKDGTWYLISGGFDGIFYGFNWTGSAWQEDNIINNSLGDIGFYSTPTIFNKGNIWYLVSGENDGGFYGFNWTGSTWQSDDGIVNGLISESTRTTLSVFNFCGITDSYNVTANNVWQNTTNIFYNDTYTAHEWQNITIRAYNSTGGGTLSVRNISQHTQIPNNPITITNTSDWNGSAGEVVYVDYDATDIDSDTATFSCNRTDLFTDFDTSTGTGNWTATANIYYVDFGVSDGYGSSSNYTMTLIESPVEITLLDELKLIMSEITTGLKSINMGNYLVYAFILIGILLIILLIQILNNCIYRG